MSRVNSDAPAEQKIVKTDVEVIKPKVKALAVTKVPSKVFSDGMSNGKGSALRWKSANLLGGMPTVSKAPSMTGEGIRAMSVGAGARAAPRDLDPVQVANANRDFDNNKHNGFLVTLKMVGLMKQHQNEPDYLAQLIKRAKDGKDSNVLEYMTGSINGAFKKDSEGNYEKTFTEADRALITKSVKAALEAGTITDEELRELATHSPGAADLAARVGIESAGVTNGSDDARLALDEVKGAYASAHSEAEKRTARLQQELANFGPALTDQQRADYIKAFKAEKPNADAYKNETLAAEALAKHLEANQAAILDSAARDPDAAKSLYESLKVLADTGLGKTALSFAVEISKDPSSALGQQFAKLPKFDEEIMVPAMSGAAAEFVAENPSDLEAAQAKFRKLTEPLKSAWEAKKGVGDLTEAYGALDEASAGTFNGLKKLAGEVSESPIKKGLAGACCVFGAACAVAKAAEGEYLEATKEFTKHGGEGLKILAGATKSLADAGKLAQYSADGLKFAKFAERLAPGLGLISSATSFALNIQKAGAEGPNAGYAIAALGDALSVMGSAFELIPVLQVPGALINGIGAVVSAGGEILGGLIADDQMKKEQSKYLAAANVKDPIKSILLQADRKQTNALKALGLTGEQIQSLAKDYPQLVRSSNGEGPFLANLAAVQKRTGLSGNQLFEMLKAASVDSKNGLGTAELMHHFVRLVDYPGINGARSTSELVQQLELEAGKTKSPAKADALRKAAAYLRTQEGPPAPAPGRRGGNRPY